MQIFRRMAHTRGQWPDTVQHRNRTPSPWKSADRRDRRAGHTRRPCPSSAGGEWQQRRGPPLRPATPRRATAAAAIWWRTLHGGQAGEKRSQGSHGSRLTDQIGPQARHCVCTGDGSDCGKGGIKCAKCSSGNTFCAACAPHPDPVNRQHDAQGTPGIGVPLGFAARWPASVGT